MSRLKLDFKTKINFCFDVDYEFNLLGKHLFFIFWSFMDVLLWHLLDFVDWWKKINEKIFWEEKHEFQAKMI